MILPYFTHKDWLCWCSMLHFQRSSLPRRTLQECDWLLKNFDLRAEARTEEMVRISPWFRHDFTVFRHHLLHRIGWDTHRKLSQKLGLFAFPFYKPLRPLPIENEGDDPELLSNHPIWGPKCCFSPDRPKAGPVSRSHPGPGERESDPCQDGPVGHVRGLSLWFAPQPGRLVENRCILARAEYFERSGNDRDHKPNPSLRSGSKPSINYGSYGSELKTNAATMLWSFRHFSNHQSYSKGTPWLEPLCFGNQTWPIRRYSAGCCVVGTWTKEEPLAQGVLEWIGARWRCECGIHMHTWA